MNWYLKVLKSYADFGGRARRMEYWMFTLFNIIFAIVMMLFDNAFDTTIGELPYGLFYALYALAIFIPGLAVAVRRLHDVGKSGWMIFIALIPIVGGIWLLVLMLTEGEPRDNEYGLNPKGIEDEEKGKALNKLDSDKVILYVVIWLLFTKLFWTFFERILYGFDSNSLAKTLSIIMYLISALIPISLAFAAKNSKTQTVLFVLGGIYLLFELYQLTTFYFRF